MAWRADSRRALTNARAFASSTPSIRLITDFPTGDRDKDATRMNQVLEQGIRKMPAQYMWTLKLFKTRP
ncbi:MAG: hypothetical protein ACE1ZA_02595, partial [Pseudomonadales bacterium]